MMLSDIFDHVSGIAPIFENVFIVFVAGLPRKPKLPFADWYSAYARSFSKAVCSFPIRKNCVLLTTASAIPQNGTIRFAYGLLTLLQGDEWQPDKC